MINRLRNTIELRTSPELPKNYSFFKNDTDKKNKRRYTHTTDTTCGVITPDTTCGVITPDTTFGVITPDTKCGVITPTQHVE